MIGCFPAASESRRLFSVHVWLRFAALWLTVALTGLVEGYVLLPFAVAAFVGAVILAVLVLWHVAEVIKLNH